MLHLSRFKRVVVRPAATRSHSSSCPGQPFEGCVARRRATSQKTALPSKGFIYTIAGAMGENIFPRNYLILCVKTRGCGAFATAPCDSHKGLRTGSASQAAVSD